jgi:hypothetical protein
MDIQRIIKSTLTTFNPEPLDVVICHQNVSRPQAKHYWPQDWGLIRCVDCMKRCTYVVALIVLPKGNPIVNSPKLVGNKNFAYLCCIQI